MTQRQTKETSRARTHRVELVPVAIAFDARDDATLLQAARDAGVVLPSSCRNGTCRTCICLLREGQVRHAIDWPGLSAEEKVEGWILPCVAMAESALVLEAPRALRSTSSEVD